MMVLKQSVIHNSQFGANTHKSWSACDMYVSVAWLDAKHDSPIGSSVSNQ